MGGACAECAKHAPYLNRKDQCVCFATDIMGTFADDATKQLTTRTKYGFETVNTGAERLAEERKKEVQQKRKPFKKGARSTKHTKRRRQERRLRKRNKL